MRGRKIVTVTCSGCCDTQAVYEGLTPRGWKRVDSEFKSVGVPGRLVCGRCRRAEKRPAPKGAP